MTKLPNSHLGRRWAAVLAGLALGVLAQPSALAQPGTWAADADGVWDQAGNWLGNSIANGPGSVAYFTHGISANRVVTLIAPRTIGSLVFSVGGGAGSRWTLAGSPLTLAGVNPTIGAVTDATLAVDLAGTNGFTKVGGGTLTLSGRRLFSGLAVVQAGTLRLAASAPVAGAPVGYWPMSEGAGDTIANAIAGGPNGALINQPTWVEGPGGPGTWAVRFNGSSQYGDITPDAALHQVGRGPLTVSAWVRTSFVGTWYSSLVTKYGHTSVTPFWGLGWSDPNELGLVARNTVGTRTQAHTGNAALNNVWRHLTGVREADNTLRIYLDGALYASVAGPDGSLTNNRPLQICYHLNTYVPASVAQVGVWDRALSAGEVATLHQHGWSPVEPPGAIAARVAAGATLELGSAQTLGSLADHLGAGGEVRLEQHDLTVGGDGSSTSFSGPLSGSGRLIKNGGGTLTLGGQVASSGAITVEQGTLAVGGSLTGGAPVTVGAGAALVLLPGSNFRFAPAAHGAVNTVAGTGQAIFSGAFVMDLPTGGAAPGLTWALVNHATLAAAQYTPGSFQVAGFTETPTGSGVWMRIEEGWQWTFRQDTGTLSVAPVINPPSVVNRPAVPHTATAVSLRGEVIDTGHETPLVTLFHGPVDAGTEPTAWQFSEELGPRRGAFSVFANGLPEQSTWYFRSRAGNSAGTVWAPETATVTTPADSPIVLLNEFMASNRSTIADEDGEFSDWIELHNPTSAEIALGGWGLSDNPAEPFKWRFPDGVVIPQHGYLLVWASGKDRPGNLAPASPPDGVNGLVLWLRADDGTFTPGQSVATWSDTSGNNNHAVQPNALRRPLFAAQAVNGLPALRFTRAAQQQLFLPTGGFAGMSDLSDFTVLTVARWGGGVTSGILGGYRGANTANPASTVLEIPAASQLRLRVGLGGNVVANNAVTANAWHLLGASMRAANVTSSLFVNGDEVASAAGHPGLTILANYDRLPVGSSHDDARTFDGDIAEFLLYNRSLPDGERQAVERYLSQKYALPLQQPTLHPHTSFRIAAEGEMLVLTRADGVTADSIGPVVSPRDLSYGRTVSDPTLWALLLEATPGAANHPNALPTRLEDVVFSHASGPHSQSFELTLSHPDPGALIVYTLDGSEPDLNNLNGTSYYFRNSYNSGPFLTNRYTSHVYAGPLTITDRSGESNKLAQIATTSDSNPPYFPGMPIKKGTVVRARAYTSGGESKVSTATYLVSNSGAFDYPLPIISLSMNEDALFDYDNGIYVAGVDHVTRTGGRICEWGNFNRRGSWAERPVHFQYFEQGQLLVDQGLGLRIHGNCSRRYPFKSVRIYAGREYDALSTMDWDFFGEPLPHAPMPDQTLFRRLVLRAPSFNEIVFSRLFHPVYEGIGGRVRPAIQFLNGEYWGVCFIKDRFDEHHLNRHYGLDPDNVVVVKVIYGHEVGSSDLRVFDLDAGQPEDMDDFHAMRQFISTSDMSNPALYAQAEELLSMESYVDHLILKIFAGDDHYAPEFIFWKARSPQDNHFGDGRWRVYVKDFDSTLRTDNYVTGLATGTHPRPFGYEIFASLLNNPEFRTRFINRFADLLNAHFLPGRFQAVIHDAFVEVAPHWPEVNQRWNSVAMSNPNSPFTEGQRQNLIRWSNEHPARQRGHLRNHFGLPGELNLTVAVADPAQGKVRLNSILISGDTPGLSPQPYPWTGVYFQGVPVTLEALPAPGHRLVGWRLNGATGFESTERAITRTFGVAAHLEAVFESVPSLHQWTFENELHYLEPSLTIGGGGLSLTPGAETTWLRNAAAQGFDSAHLRVNSPLGSELIFDLPTVGYGELSLSFHTRRSGEGAGRQTVSGTLNGSDWIELASYDVLDAEPQLKTFDLSALAGAANNPAFAIRITFAQGEGGFEGNHRFDNINLMGVPVGAANHPPVVIGSVSPPPLIENGTAFTVNLADVFADSDGDPLEFSAAAGPAGRVSLGLAGSLLTVTPQQRGESVVTIRADDGGYSVGTSFRVLIHPQAHALAEGPTAFGYWSASEPAGTYPPHMIFLQGEENDSTLNTVFPRAYHIPLSDAAVPADVDFPYAATSRTRINGLGAAGISFINTGRGRDLGGAVLAINTLGVSDGARVGFTAGTVLPNSRVYALRLQYRLGADGPFTDVLDAHSQPVQYIRQITSGHSVTIGPVHLPLALLNQPYAQLMWRYHHLSGNSGPRAQLRLDDILVWAGSAPARFSEWQLEHFPDPDDRANPDLAGPGGNPSGDGVANLVRYALDIGPYEAVGDRLPRVQVEPDGALEYRFRFDPTKTDLVWRVVASADLEVWTHMLFDSMDEVPPPLENGWLRLRLPPSLNGGEIPDPRMFLRLELSFRTGQP